MFYCPIMPQPAIRHAEEERWRDERIDAAQKRRSQRTAKTNNEVIIHNELTQRVTCQAVRGQKLRRRRLEQGVFVGRGGRKNGHQNLVRSSLFLQPNIVLQLTQLGLSCGGREVWSAAGRAVVEGAHKSCDFTRRPRPARVGGPAARYKCNYIAVQTVECCLDLNRGA
ncbi:hypothetical protein EVAR_62612_1 [Eumeta japonica]|uniref:Uncharacterized protein n=1 Tax=Eumeta variegata TaxID=151549 RepID=A0A4C1ZGF8_EUMVA|nr:hypothetical protein EVAR_62612_1 [Eumeta japonica]